jgi:hypothetical protein
MRWTLPIPAARPCCVAAPRRSAAFCGRALKAVMVLIALAALAASIPALSRADFPLASLLIYVIGMAFVAIPLLLYHEYLLKLCGQPAAPAD